MNQTIKTKLTVATKETRRGSYGPLPAVLWKIRASPNKVTQLTPFEIMTGRAMTLPGDAPPLGTDSGGFHQMLRAYLQILDESIWEMKEDRRQTKETGRSRWVGAGSRKSDHAEKVRSKKFANTLERALHSVSGE